jgi:hypothetical protein
MDKNIWDELEFTNEEKMTVAAIFFIFFKKFLDNPFIENPIIQYGCKKEIDKIQNLVHLNLQSLHISLRELPSYQISNSVWNNMNFNKRNIVIIVLNLFLDISKGNDLFANVTYQTLIEVIKQLKCKFTGDLNSGFKFL